MHIFLKVVGAFAIVLVSFFGTLFLLDYRAAPCSQGTAVDFKAPFQRIGTGFAYVAAAPSLEDRSDTGAAASRSNFFVCENGNRLGPAHSVHSDIATIGKGRFSHWASAFIFSASDNSDPNTNGRRYWAVPGLK
jgi:hypothetical protein